MNNMIIKSHNMINCIGIDIGNGLTTSVINKCYIPISSSIEFVIPNVMEKYNIGIYIGNNILSSDNILIISTRLEAFSIYVKRTCIFLFNSNFSIRLELSIFSPYK